MRCSSVDLIGAFPGIRSAAPARARQRRRSSTRSAIVGLGLIGGSIALAARAHLADAPRDRRRPQGRARDGDGAGRDRRRGRRPGRRSRRRDLVVLAAPVRQNIVCLRELAELSEPPRHRRRQHEAGDRRGGARRCRHGFTFVGGHPLAGAARGGLEHARGRSVRGRPWLFTPPSRAPARRTRAAAGVRARRSGRAAMVMSADGARSAARLSQPSAAVGRQRADARGRGGRRGRARSRGRGLADTTRLASSPADIWGDICATNADDRPARSTPIATLQELRRDLARGDRAPTCSSRPLAGASAAAVSDCERNG